MGKDTRPTTGGRKQKCRAIIDAMRPGSLRLQCHSRCEPNRNKIYGFYTVGWRGFTSCSGSNRQQWKKAVRCRWTCQVVAAAAPAGKPFGRWLGVCPGKPCYGCPCGPKRKAGVFPPTEGEPMTWRTYARRFCTSTHKPVRTWADKETKKEARPKPRRRKSIWRTYATRHGFSKQNTKPWHVRPKNEGGA